MQTRDRTAYSNMIKNIAKTYTHERITKKVSTVFVSEYPHEVIGACVHVAAVDTAFDVQLYIISISISIYIYINHHSRRIYPLKHTWWTSSKRYT
jgi:hypothetical protein